MPNVSLCAQENELHYTPIQYICKLTLNDGSIVNIEGSGELTSAMTVAYSATCVSAEIGDLCTSIGSHAFSQGNNKGYPLTSVTIPDSVTTIGNYAFTRCTSLTSVTIPSSATSIGISAFYNCTSLTSITIPSGVTSIGGNAFARCSGLTSISVDSNNAVYDSRGNCNAIIETATNTLISGCKNTIIPNSVTSIGNAFEGCSGLTSITIPNSVTTIGTGAFADCTSLTEVTIPDSVTRIGDGAFNSCGGLTSVTIPNTVTSIGNAAFARCSNLTSVFVEATTPPTLGFGVFANNESGRKIYVPSGSVDVYKAATNWSEYTSDIEPIQ